MPAPLYAPGVNIGNAVRICIVNYSVVASSFFRFAIHRLFMEDHTVLQRAMRVIKENNNLDLIAMFCILIQKLPIDYCFSWRKRKYLEIKTTLLILKNAQRFPRSETNSGILEQSMGARNRVGIGLSYCPARLHRLAESIPGNRYLGSLKV
jgi:hypothetical protein